MMKSSWSSMVLVVITLHCVFSQPYEPTPLGYDYDALEPYIDAETMRVHHVGHYKAYADKFSSAARQLRSMPEYKHLVKLGVDGLLTKLDEVPVSLRDKIRNNGGGYVNHELYFASMSKDGGGEPEGAIRRAIDQDFGSFSKFVSGFTSLAEGRFGAGWVWLVVDTSTEDNTLKILSTQNQDTPQMISPDMVPLLGLDVWEHAYYLKYKNNRRAYIDAWWNVVDWAAVNERYIQGGFTHLDSDMLPNDDSAEREL